MSHNLLGRLPPLQAIGRSKCVDLDDPPTPVDDDTEDLVDSYLRSLEQDSAAPPTYTFEIEHAASTSTALSTGFRVLPPGNRYCKKVSAQVTGFTHCEKSVSFAGKHRELDRLLQYRAQLEFTKDLLSRVNSFGVFVKDLRQLVKDEYQTWHQICRDSLTSAPTTKLEQLCFLCEDLRMHLNQWNSIKQSLHRNRHLQPILPSFCSNLEVVRCRLADLSEVAVFWLNRLILVGFKVLAHSDLERISQEALWNVARGLEEYNTIVSSTQVVHACGCLNDFYVARHGGASTSTAVRRFCVCADRRNSVVPLAKVLNLFAHERSKYAGASTKVYFTGSKEFISLVKNTRLPLYSWYSRTTQPNASLGRPLPTRGSSNAHRSSPLSTFLHVTGDIFAPDLSAEISPLIDFARRETTFVGRFLQVVCHSTSMIKKQSPRPGADAKSVSVSSRLKRLRPKAIGFSAAQVVNSNADDRGEHVVENQESKSSLIKAENESDVAKVDPTRKCVSWVDSLLAVSIQNMTQDYVHILWSHFGDQVYHFLVGSEWGNMKDAKERLGAVLLCPDTVAMVMVHMIQHASLGDAFPLGCRFALASVALRLHASVAWAVWDGALNSALASASVDKCQPSSPTNDIYCTATGKLLRDTYLPIHSVLSALANLTIHPPADGSSVIELNESAPSAVFSSALKRIKTTVDLCFSWCSEKTSQCAASRAVSSFLLVAFSDLQMLTDEGDRAFRACQELYDALTTSEKKPDRDALWDVEESWKIANKSRCHLQTLVSSSQKQFHQLCLSSSRDFFHNEMPTGKEWKRKSGEVLPVQHLEYIERAVDSLLEPVVSSVSQLRPTAQFDALSMAIGDICDAWTSNILSKKIRFSYHGACQLELDVLYVKTWLSSYISDTQLCHHLTSLDFIHYLNCIITLLKQQPTGQQRRRSGSRVRQQPIGNAEKGFRDIGPDGTQSISNASTCTPSSDTTEDSKNGMTWESKMAAIDRSSKTSTVTGNSGSLEDGDSENRSVPDREQWLALRVHGGSRSWPKFGFCFNNTNV